MGREERRAEIVATLARHVLAHGLAGAGLRSLARVVGTSDRMLLYYFMSKEDLLSAVLEQIAANLARSLQAIFGEVKLPPARALERIWQVLKQGSNSDPVRLWIECASRASRGDPFFRVVVDRIRENWVTWLSAVLDTPAADRAPLAALMMAAVDGQVVLQPTNLAQGDAAIRLLVRLLKQRASSYPEAS
ncbi:MAG TPA: TetR/AcrR family transcriptional regulator [Verrucomicrobiae bacterium]|nr:TetR/AcrR family transcriptional regulator [Verrucomicrobiae bacterium]